MRQATAHQLLGGHVLGGPEGFGERIDPLEQLDALVARSAI
jgi:hypothetical protein